MAALRCRAAHLASTTAAAWLKPRIQVCIGLYRRRGVCSATITKQARVIRGPSFDLSQRSVTRER